MRRAARFAAFLAVCLFAGAGAVIGLAVLHDAFVNANALATVMDYCGAGPCEIRRLENGHIYAVRGELKCRRPARNDDNDVWRF